MSADPTPTPDLDALEYARELVDERVHHPDTGIMKLATALLASAREREALEKERDKFKGHYETLSSCIQAEAAEHQRFRNEVAERWSLKGPPKGNQEHPHWWHSLVYRLEQRISELETTRATAEAALTAARQQLEAATTGGVYWHSEIGAWVIDVPPHGAMKMDDALDAARQRAEEAEDEVACHEVVQGYCIDGEKIDVYARAVQAAEHHKHHAQGLRAALEMTRNTLGDLRGGFARSVDPERWVRDLQAHIDAARASTQEPKP